MFTLDADVDPEMISKALLGLVEAAVISVKAGSTALIESARAVTCVGRKPVLATPSTQQTHNNNNNNNKHT